MLNLYECRHLFLALVFSSSCQSVETTPVESATQSLIYTVPDKSSSQRIVAKVNGAPIDASCVENQMEASGIGQDAALEECIGFELLAQEAMAQKLYEAPDVQEVAKREAVRTYIDKHFVLKTPDDIPESELLEYWQLAKGRINRPELRTTDYCRFTLAETASPSEAEDAEKSIKALKAQLGATTTLATFRDLCFEATSDPYVKTRHGIVHSKVQFVSSVDDNGEKRPQKNAGKVIDRSLAKAVYDIKEVNGVSKAIKTERGWELYFLRHIAPAVDMTYDEAKEDMKKGLFADEAFKKRLFSKRVFELGKKDNIKAHHELITESVHDAP